MEKPGDTPLLWNISPKVAEYCARLAQRLEVPFNRAVVYYSAMYLAKEEIYSREERCAMFPNEPPENRKILLSLLEKVVIGNNLPDIDEL